MKIYVSNLNESWIVDRLRNEWIHENDKFSTDDIKEADIIWIISPWTWNKIPKRHLKNKYVFCTIHHLEETDFKGRGRKEFFKRDRYVNMYHTISQNSYKQIDEMTDKKIEILPFWVNEKQFFHIDNKEKLRRKYNLPTNSFIIGSFQRDTEGKDLKTPKMIKGPDRFIEIVKNKSEQYPDLTILLTGKRRAYIISRLEELNIKYRYFEMIELDELNELYNCLDLYIVSSRIEGGPQAIFECAITKTNIISTDVGIAREILSENSIFNMENFENAVPDIETAYTNVQKYTKNKGIERFNSLFYKIINEIQ